MRSAALFWRPDLNNPPTSVGGIPELGVIASRLDLNNPPTPVTPVGGISELSQSRYREVMLTH